MILQNSELHYVALIFTLLVVPHFFHRLKLPTAIITFLLGIICAELKLFQIDITISLMSIIGINALFLFAGMEVDFQTIRKESKILVIHVLIQMVMLLAVAFAIQRIFGLDWRPTILIALALVTPSTGFILDSLHSSLNETQRFWVKAVAIGTEIVALGIMFLVLQSDSLEHLGLSFLAMIGIVVALPLLFRAFAKLVAPHAPHADFAFFIMLAILCGFLTKKLGAYYLIGAFIVGVVAQRFHGLFASRDSDQTLASLRLFSTFFIPFYFFKAGLGVNVDGLFNWQALGLGTLFLVIVAPLRIGVIFAHARFIFDRKLRGVSTVALSLLPTLVFGLVLIDILQTRFAAPSLILNGLIIYTVLVTIAPRFLIKSALGNLKNT